MFRMLFNLFMAFSRLLIQTDSVLVSKCESFYFLVNARRGVQDHTLP
jgi:hypothetical protein